MGDNMVTEQPPWISEETSTMTQSTLSEEFYGQLCESYNNLGKLMRMLMCVYYFFLKSATKFKNARIDMEMVRNEVYATLVRTDQLWFPPKAASLDKVLSSNNPTC